MTEAAPAGRPSLLGAGLSRLSRGQGASGFDPTLRSGSLAAMGAAVAAKAARGLFWRSLLCGDPGVVLVGRGASIRHPRHIHVAGALVVEDYAEIQGLSTGGVRFGHRVTVGRFASIRPSGYYGREIGAGLDIGDHSNIGPYCFIGCAGPVRIGSRVMMGQGVCLLAERHGMDDTDQPMQDQGVTRAGIVIEDDCWLGAGAKILDGVTIGRGSVVGAGAVVTKSFPPRSVIGGVPAVLLRSRDGEPVALSGMAS
jgi:acetyltransferase-like isoleucine patch superfamily enzyme